MKWNQNKQSVITRRVFVIIKSYIDSGAPAHWIKHRSKIKGRKGKYLKFRPYINPMSIRPHKPSDHGYYFKMYKGNIPLIQYTLEDNGFKESSDTPETSSF